VAAGGARFVAVKSSANDDNAVRGRPKSRGPGVAMLTSKGYGRVRRPRGGGQHSRSRTVAKKPSTGESANEAVPTIVCGTPDGVRCDRGDDTRVLFTFAHGAADAIGASGVPRALLRGRRDKRPTRSHRAREQFGMRRSD